ncbi:MAG: copper homeostasis protein CutC [Chloroflexi bacterium]|nr:copper homeostasis protein CutC [Ardenticatenaceae bacterium]MBL1128179.1 copper homeostasis protein CutC [Chloroflexota bacterium]NOG34252.1 copper homeostasis protein CutC [Chloroflexota bacterium]GIK56366.1 MAG: copper homeostasis protein CutC [Chloroflexota bacterium]
MLRVQVEICINCTTVTAVQQQVAAACRGGADTVELCSQMELDGLTPKREHIVAARVAFGDRPGLMVMIRPRAGDFCYTSEEVTEMRRQIETAAAAGANGVVFGLLSGQALAVAEMRQLTQWSHSLGLIVTCHRTFDAVANQAEALEQLIEIGVDRVLTSGTPWGSSLPATAGVAQLAEIMRQANNRLEISIGGGLDPHNAPALLAQLPLTAGRLAVHSYSGVLDGEGVSEKKVSRLVQTARRVDDQERRENDPV